MPIKIFIKQRKVSVTEETNGILQCYQASLEQNQIKLEDDERGRHSDASSGKVSERQDFWSKYVTSGLELITDSSLGAKVVELESLELYLEAPAEILLRSYISFLNSLLVKQELTAENTETQEITSKYVLTRELLYRLVGIALSNKLDKEHDGERLVAVLKSFTQALTNKEYFLITGSFFSSSKPSKFLIELTSYHPAWVNQIIRMVSAVKMIRSNSVTISNALAYLKTAEATIQRQLAVFLDEKLTPNMLASEWIDYTLDACQTKLLRSNMAVAEKAIISNETDLTHQQTKVLAVVATKFHHKQKKIEELYNLLNKTNVLYEIMSHLDLLITYTSWMPILSGMINFKKLTDLLRHHGELCNRILSITPELVNTINNQAMRGLIKYDAIAGGELSYFVEQTVSVFEHLQDTMLKQRIGNMISASLSSLLSLQANLSPEYQFVNCDGQDFDSLLPRRETKTARLINNEPADNEYQQLKLTYAQLHEQQKSLQQENVRLAKERNKLVDDNYIVKSAITELLHKSLINGCQAIEVLETLYQGGADLEGFCDIAGTYFSYKPIHVAAETENLVACKWLLERGVAVNSLDNNHETALDKASRKSAYKIINYLKSKHGFSKEIQDCTQQMHRVIERIGTDLSLESAKHELQLLMLRGADVNGVNTLEDSKFFGKRPLHTLLVMGNNNLITSFIHGGADLNLLDAHNQATPYQYCCCISPPQNIEAITIYLVECHPKEFFNALNSNFALRVAAKHGHLKTLRLLLAENAVDPADMDNYAICIAAAAGHVEVVQLLLQKSRVNPSVGNNYPIRVAAEKGNLKVVELLLKDKRVDIKARTRALVAAEKFGHIAIANLLKRNRAIATQQPPIRLAAPYDIEADKLTSFLQQISHNPQQARELLKNQKNLALLFNEAEHYLEGKKIFEEFYPAYRASLAQPKISLTNLSCRNIASTHTEAIYCVRILSGNRLATGSQDNTVKIIDLNTGECQIELLGHTDWVHCLQELPGNRLATGSSDKTIKIWNLATGEYQVSLAGHENSIFDIKVLPGNKLASCSADQTIRIWDLAVYSLQNTLKGHDQAITCLQVLSGNRLASGSNDKTIKIWDLASYTYQSTLIGHDDFVKCLQTTLDNLLISGSRDKTIKVWNLNNNTCIKTLAGHTGGVCSMQLLPDNIHFVSSSLDNTMKIWNLNSYDAHAVPHPVTFSMHAESGQMVTISGKTLKIWDLTALKSAEHTDLVQLDMAAHNCKMM